MTAYSGTYTLSWNGDFNKTKDMGATHTYRYISVPAKPAVSTYSNTSTNTYNSTSGSASFNLSSSGINSISMICITIFPTGYELDSATFFNGINVFTRTRYVTLSYTYSNNTLTVKGTSAGLGNVSATWKVYCCG